MGSTHTCGSSQGSTATSAVAISESNLLTNNLERVFSDYSKVNGVGNSSSFGLASLLYVTFRYIVEHEEGFDSSKSNLEAHN